MFDFNKPNIEITEISEDKKYGRFVVEPLERGYGTTLGNSLRRIMLSSLPGAAISQVKIERVGGNLTDHYDPRSKVLRLSETVYGSESVAAIGVAAHECGHAIQDDVGYVPIKIRGAIVPVVSLGSALCWPLFLIGLLMGAPGLVNAGIILFSLVVAFQLVTLPVEFNASGRALRILDGAGILEGNELQGAGKVLRAAALTYVASALSSILQLLRLVLLSGRRRN